MNGSRATVERRGSKRSEWVAEALPVALGATRNQTFRPPLPQLVPCRWHQRCATLKHRPPAGSGIPPVQRLETA